jgi:galactose mutarotase-like enzyme
MKGVVLENQKLRLVLMPEFGARILSIIYKPTETEFVWHNPRVPVMRPTYKPEFEDMSGLFDCVPTCEGCTFKTWKLPFYGEVASEPWRLLGVGRKSGSITVRLQRKCAVYPLMIHKAVRIAKNEPSVELKYRLVNLSNQRLEYHYSGHNTLLINPNYRIVLPPEVTSLKLGMAVNNRLGNAGEQVSWPITTDSTGKSVDLSKVGQPNEGTGENLYSNALRESWCAALNESRREAIGFSFDARILPYLLIWINWGGYLGYYHMALEPSTGRPDNLAVAVNEWKNYATLEAGSDVSWTTKIFIKHEIKRVKRVDAQKGIEE